MELDQAAPDFRLADQDGFLHRLSDYRGRIVVLAFSSSSCPHAERADRELADLRAAWGEQVVPLVVLSGADEGPGASRLLAQARSLPVVLRDGDHALADLYQAEVTPHLFVLDRDGRLRYRGALDDTSLRRRNPTRSFLKEAVEALLAGSAPDPAETTPFGCALVRFVLE